MPGNDIFISYSRADRAAAYHFAECFAQEGFTVWWDAALQSGETFDEVIEAELRSAKAVVVLWSPRSVTSRWVRAEATLADRRKKFAPVIIEACDRPIIFELNHTPDLSEWNGDTSDSVWQGFVEGLRRLVERGKASQSPAPVAGEGADAAPAPKRTPAERFARRPSEPKAEPAGGDSEELLFARSEPAAAAVNKANGQAKAEPDPVDQKQSTARANGTDALGDEFHCLEINGGPNLAKRFVVNPLGLKIGRTAPADIVLPDSRVSRSHCLVELAGDHLHVSDLNSTNGTYIDGKRVKGSAYLKVGSVLRVGDVSFTHAKRSCAEV